jgi:hypothetical protein
MNYVETKAAEKTSEDDSPTATAFVEDMEGNAETALANNGTEEPESIGGERKADETSLEPTIEALGLAENTHLSPIGEPSQATADVVLSASVHPDRKRDLLLQARTDRIMWIQQAPLPYKILSDSSDPWSRDERLTNLKDSHGGNQLPTVIEILSNLYGLNVSTTPEEVASRLEISLGEKLQRNDSAIPTGEHRLNAELASRIDDPVLRAYHVFFNKLKNPACSALVQGMRTFCRSLQDINDAAALSRKMQAYLSSTMSALKMHVVWKKDGVDEYVRRSFESFIYGHCRHHIEDVLWDQEAQAKETAWQQRLESLQFVTPKHLEVEYLDTPNLTINQMLEAPIAALLSIETYSSPFEKLQCILKVYQFVNESLTSTLNQDRQEGSKDKLPSADDVLPTIILTVLRAKPKRLHLSLHVMEEFCLSEYLRGEAGYAFTNIYGAVQFLLDLDMNEPQSLSITTEEFRLGLKASQLIAEELLAAIQAKKLPPLDSLPHESGEEQTSLANIPVSAVRSARLNGEAVDVDWALAWQSANGMFVSDEVPILKESRSALESVTDVLPSGFSRSYSFLTTRPEDIRVSDLAQLLSEYRMLVHTTETLLGERVSQLSAQRKSKILAREKEIYSRAQKVDPSLLPTNHSLSKSSK